MDRLRGGAEDVDDTVIGSQSGLGLHLQHHACRDREFAFLWRSEDVSECDDEHAAVVGSLGVGEDQVAALPGVAMVEQSSGAFSK